MLPFSPLAHPTIFRSHIVRFGFNIMLSFALINLWPFPFTPWLSHVRMLCAKVTAALSIQGKHTQEVLTFLVAFEVRSHDLLDHVRCPILDLQPINPKWACVCNARCAKWR